MLVELATWSGTENIYKGIIMKDPQRSLKNLQEQALAAEARRVLDDGDMIGAIALVEKISGYWQENLITIMSVIAFAENNDELVRRAKSLFYRHLGNCTNPKTLVFAALWIQNPKRAHVLPAEFRIAVDRQRRKLEPEWDGVWDNPGLGLQNEIPALIKRHPTEVSDPEACLKVAGQSSDWYPWVHQYLKLGGSTENPRYLKLWVSKSVPSQKAPTDRIKGLLKKFVEFGDVGDVRRFLKGITPVRYSLKGDLNPNTILAKHALLLYCNCDRLGHTVDDWMHISRSALHLGDSNAGRIAQCNLLKINGTADIHEMLWQLAHRFGNPAVPRTR